MNVYIPKNFKQNLGTNSLLFISLNYIIIYHFAGWKILLQKVCSSISSTPKYIGFGFTNRPTNYTNTWLFMVVHESELQLSEYLVLLIM